MAERLEEIVPNGSDFAEQILLFEAWRLMHENGVDWSGNMGDVALLKARGLLNDCRKRDLPTRRPSWTVLRLTSLGL